MNETQRLSDVCEFIIDCEHKTAPVVKHGIPSIRTTDLKNGRIVLESCNKVSEETYKEWTNRLEPQYEDIILSREAPVGEIGIIPFNAKLCLGQRTVLIRLKKDLIEPRFLLYLFLTDKMRHELISRSEGSVVPHLNMSDIRSFPLPDLPPLPTQRRIAHILGSLDDKIELNRQMNETLETMARAIFKSWFVDFDPVRAKAEGRQPAGMDAEMAALFPDGFEEVDGREVPRGWKVDSLSEVCDKIFSGGTPSTANLEYWDGAIPWLSSGETRSHFIVHTDKKITQKGIENSSTRFVRAGATVIASAGQGHTRGQTSLLMLNCYINQSIVALIANSKAISDSYLFFELSRRYQELRQISDSHSSRGSLTTTLLAQLDLVIPSMDVISIFDRITKPMVKKIYNNTIEINILTQIRDTLLPKLMNGEIRIETSNI